MVKNVLVITLGAGAGACLRWVLAMLLNSIFPAIPLGTVKSRLRLALSHLRGRLEDLR